MLYFFELPKDTNVLMADANLLIAAYLLMKHAGQVVISQTDLQALARDYSGHTLAYDGKTESFTVTLRMRPDTYPRKD